MLFLILVRNSIVFGSAIPDAILNAVFDAVLDAIFDAILNVAFDAVLDRLIGAHSCCV